MCNMLVGLAGLVSFEGADNLGGGVSLRAAMRNSSSSKVQFGFVCFVWLPLCGLILFCYWHSHMWRTYKCKWMCYFYRFWLLACSAQEPGRKRVVFGIDLFGSGFDVIRWLVCGGCGPRLTRRFICVPDTHAPILEILGKIVLTQRHAHSWVCHLFAIKKTPSTMRAPFEVTNLSECALTMDESFVLLQVLLFVRLYKMQVGWNVLILFHRHICIYKLYYLT